MKKTTKNTTKITKNRLKDGVKISSKEGKKLVKSWKYIDKNGDEWQEYEKN